MNYIKTKESQALRPFGYLLQKYFAIGYSGNAIRCHRCRDIMARSRWDNSAKNVTSII